MAHATKTATDKDRELAAELEAANEQLNEAKTRAAAHRGRAAKLRQQLDQRPVDEFGPTGEPLPDTEAARLADEIAELPDANGFARVIRGHGAAVDKARMALFQHRQHHAHELLDELEPEGREAVDDWLGWAAEGESRYQRLVEVGTKAQQVVARQHSAEQRAFGRVPEYEDQRRLIREAQATPPLPLPATYLAEREAERAEDEQDEGDDE